MESLLRRRSGEQLSCSVANREHRWVFQFSFHRDGVKAVADIFSTSDTLHAALLFDLLFEHRWNGEDSDPGLSEGPQQGVVLKLSGNVGPDSKRVEPMLKVSPHCIDARWM